ncbi:MULTISPECIES: hypothetical protein [unclassified Clostridium]|uniref:hypothetical protein n=1 Tax=unclassified Clostridium TaxID=2614128 RepID=UPI0025C2D33B|nr:MULTISPECIES: hypothetical protein [unclassified Clostridium]
MKKNEILFIGHGQAGNNIADCVVTKSKRRFLSYYINSSLKDIMALKNDKNKNIADNYFVIPNADGCGRDQKLSKEYMSLHGANIIDDILKGYQRQRAIYVAHSTDGGTGGGSAIPLMKGLRRTIQAAKLDKKVIGISVLPSWELKSKIGKENALAYWNEMISNSDAYDFMYVINNYSRKATDDYSKINNEFAELINLSYDICVGDENGTIDTKDREKMYTVKGSKDDKENLSKIAVMYKLPDNISDARIALEAAKSSSIFAKISNMSCKNLLISLKNDTDLDSQDIINEFNYENEVIEGVNPYCNFVMATGIPIDSILEDIQMIQESLEDDKKSRENKPAKSQRAVDLKIEIESEIAAQSISSKNTKEVAPDIDDILEDDDFFSDIFG